LELSQGGICEFQLRILLRAARRSLLPGGLWDFWVWAARRIEPGWHAPGFGPSDALQLDASSVPTFHPGAKAPRFTPSSWLRAPGQKSFPRGAAGNAEGFVEITELAPGPVPNGAKISSLWEVRGVSVGERGTGFQPVICESHSQDGCAALGSTGGVNPCQASILGDLQRTVSSQMVLKFAPFGPVPRRRPSALARRKGSRGKRRGLMSHLSS
jgi:hypothetical protein